MSEVPGEDNPYVAPASEVADRTAPLTEHQRLRQSYLEYESQVRSAGVGLLIVGVALGGWALTAITDQRVVLEPESGLDLLHPIVGAAGVLGCILGAGLYRLSSKARLPSLLACLVVGALLLVYTSWTILGLCALYAGWLLRSEPVKTLFTEGYQELIALTPDMKAGLHPYARIAFGVVVLGGGVGYLVVRALF